MFPGEKVSDAADFDDFEASTTERFIVKPLGNAFENEVRMFPGMAAWTGWAQDAAALVGPEAIAKIMQSYGGTRLYIPVRMQADHPLSRLVGYAAAIALSDAYGGQEHFDVPKGDASDRLCRDKSILEDRKAGLSGKQVAMKYRLTERQVRNIFRKQGC